MNTIQVQKNTRQSGVELLKIIAVFLIVISHIVQSVTEQSPVVSSTDYLIPLNNATTDFPTLIMSILRYSGVLGNTIFFVCSAWFLVGRKKTDRRKALRLISEVWTLSVIFCIINLIIRSGNIPVTEIIKQFFPTTFAIYWYMTCYIIFLFAYPFLNILIDNLTQKQLLRIIIVMSFLYVFVGFLTGTLFFPSNLILWCTIYFIIAYIKLYLPDMKNNKKINALLLIFGIVGFVGIIILTNFLGLHISYFSDQLLRWNSNCNPFGLLIAVGALNLFRNIKISSKFINYFSCLSMPVYLISENYFFRQYYRPVIWQWFYTTYGYNNILLITFIYSFAVFAAASVISIIYKETIQKAVSKISLKLYALISEIWLSVEKVLINIK